MSHPSTESAAVTRLALAWFCHACDVAGVDEVEAPVRLEPGAVFAPPPCWNCEGPTRVTGRRQLAPVRQSAA